MNISELLKITLQKKASDLHLVTGVMPTIRIDGALFSIPQTPVLTFDDTKDMLTQILTAEQLRIFESNKALDFSYKLDDQARFRVNAYIQSGSVAMAFRLVPAVIPTIDSLNLPPILHSLVSLKQGLVLVTGPTGHGKSTALAAMINEINEKRSEHVVTVEDPIEFIFKPQKSIISQRELGRDTLSFNESLKSVLREDPNVVLIGEMRDYDTVSATMTIAETGHLVFSTLHTNSAAQTIDRIVDVFPENQQNQVRMQLSSVIEAVISMRLVPKRGGGRVPAYEIMLANAAIRNSIREGKTHLIGNILQTSFEMGMTTLEMCLANLVNNQIIDIEVAIEYALQPTELARLVKR